MARDFDVLVAGAGPAGCAAAITLARSGLHVAILDRQAFPRRKLCGGLLTWKTMRQLEHLTGCDDETLRQRGIIDHVSSDFSVLLRDKVFFRGTSDYPFHLVQRKRFDSFLLNQAKALGVAFFPETSVRACDPTTASVVTLQDLALNARWLVGADGVHSQVRRSFPQQLADKRAWLRNLADTVEIAIPRNTVSGLPDHPCIYAGYVKGGYAWVFPNETRHVIGILALQRNDQHLGKAFRDFLKDIGLPRDVWPHFAGHSLPLGNFLSRPIHGSTLLVGDAAGMVEPLLGEGVYYALATGRAAAEAIIDADKGVDELEPAYLGRLRRHILPELRGGKRFRWLFHNLDRPFTRGVSALFSRLMGRRLVEIVQGSRSWATLGKQIPY